MKQYLLSAAGILALAVSGFAVEQALKGDEAKLIEKVPQAAMPLSAGVEKLVSGTEAIPLSACLTLDDKGQLRFNVLIAERGLSIAAGENRFMNRFGWTDGTIFKTGSEEIKELGKLSEARAELGLLKDSRESLLDVLCRAEGDHANVFSIAPLTRDGKNCFLVRCVKGKEVTEFQYEITSRTEEIPTAWEEEGEEWDPDLE